MSEGFETKSTKAKESSRHQRKPIEIASIGAIQQSLVEHFSDIKDPRVERTKKHQLADILVIAILAVIAGEVLKFLPHSGMLKVLITSSLNTYAYLNGLLAV